MKRLFILCLLIFVLIMGMKASAQNSAAAGTLSLKQAIETGIANSQDVIRAGLLKDAAEINWKEAKANRYPSLNANAGYGINQGRNIDPTTNSYINEKVNFSNYGLNSSVLIFNGLSLHNAIKQNNYTFQATKMDFQQAKDNLTISIILAYLQVLNNEDLLSLANNQRGVTSKQVERLEVLNKEGAIAPSALAEIKGLLGDNDLSVINAQNSLETAKINLCALMNVAYDKNMQLERISIESIATKYETSADSVYQTALDQFALIKAAELRVKSAESAVRSWRGNLFPRLTLDGNLGTTYSSGSRRDILLGVIDEPTNAYVIVNGNPTPVIVPSEQTNSVKIPYRTQLDNNLNSQISLNLSIPIFNAFQARNRVKRAKIDLKTFELADRTTKTQLQQDVEQAHLNMTTSLSRYRVLIDQVKAYEESFHAAEVRFQVGLGTSIDYLNAKNNLDRTNINLVIAKYDYVLRTKILDYYQGKQLW